MTMLSLSDVSRDFITRGKTIQAMAGVSLDVSAGEFRTVVGPSGCGKSTLLNIVCGLLAPSRGSVLYKGARLTGVNTEIGYVTQADNLYPWRTLRENVEFPLEIRGVARGERPARAPARRLSPPRRRALSPDLRHVGGDLEAEVRRAPA